MTDDTKVVLRDGQWLGSDGLFADFGKEEVVVVLEQAAIDHHLLSDLGNNEKGQSMRSSREAMHLASLAATHAKARQSLDADGRILITVQDLIAAK